MSTLTNLKDLALQQRKDAAAGTGGEHAAFLALILSDANTIAKKAQRETTDADAETAIRAAVKAFDKTLAGTPSPDGDTSKDIPPVPVDSDYGKKVVAQRDAIAALVLPMLTGDALNMAIRDAADAMEAEIAPGSMGKIMGWLNRNHPGRIDGFLVKQVLATGAV